MLIYFLYFTIIAEEDRQNRPKNTTGKGVKVTEEKVNEEVKGGGEGT